MQGFKMQATPHLFFALLNLLFLLAGEELANLFVPAKNPLVHNSKLSRCSIEGMINTPAQPLTLT